MSYTMKLWEIVIEYHLNADNGVEEGIWIYTWEIGHGSNLFVDEIDRNIQGKEEGFPCNIYIF